MLRFHSRRITRSMKSFAAAHTFHKLLIERRHMAPIHTCIIAAAYLAGGKPLLIFLGDAPQTLSHIIGRENGTECKRALLEHLLKCFRATSPTSEPQWHGSEERRNEEAGTERVSAGDRGFASGECTNILKAMSFHVQKMQRREKMFSSLRRSARISSKPRRRVPRRNIWRTLRH